MKKYTSFSIIYIATLILTISNLSAQNLVAHFKFDNNLNDETGNYTMVTTGYTDGELTYVNDENSNALSALNSTFSSYTTNDYISSNTNFSLTGDAHRTVAAWVKTPALGTERSIVGWGTASTNNKFTFLINTDGFLRLEKQGAGFNSIVVDDDTWKHVALTYNGSAAVLYVNGVQVASANWSGIGTAIGPLYIANSVQKNRSFSGSINDIQIYDEALTTTQLTTISSGAVLGVKDVAFAKGELKVFPNAVTDYLNIETSLSSKVDITVYDLQGKIILKSYTNKVDMRSLTAGLYVVNVRSGGKVTDLKIIKK